jgi:hypothetical protein
MMTTKVKRYTVAVALSIVLAGLGACGKIGPFNSNAYQQATALKVDALALVDMAKGKAQYGDHNSEAQAVLHAVDQAYEFATNRPSNDVATRQWAILRNPTGHLLGGFVAKWKNDGALSDAFVVEARQIISQAFDQIIGLEVGRIKSDQVKDLGQP